jgi:hypothetical protein
MLDKTFDPASFEGRIYEGWERSGAFAAGDRPDAEPFTIMIPPPNVTGSLHIGHALDNTLQDVLVRWRRMQGRDALWQPGTDHAGIATADGGGALLASQGQDRRAMGREAFLRHVWEWKAQSGGTITRQLRRLGASLDWKRERFTMDEGLSAAVRETFVSLHRDGLIYRDKRLVNWDPSCRPRSPTWRWRAARCAGTSGTCATRWKASRAASSWSPRRGRNHARRHRRSLCIPRTPASPTSWASAWCCRWWAFDPGGRRRLLRPGEGQRRRQDHPRARLQRLRGGASARPPHAVRARRRGARPVAEIEGDLRAGEGVADPEFVAASPAGAVRTHARRSSPAWKSWASSRRRRRTPTRCRTATAAVCRWSRA